MTATVVVPFRSEDPERLRIFQWCVYRWAALCPGYPIITPHDDKTEGPFNRSKAVNRGVALADTEVVIVADADIAVIDIQAKFMVTVLTMENPAPWVIGYDLFQQWTPQATKFALKGDPADPLPVPVRSRWESRESVCGLLALRREDYEAIGGFNETAQGWGGEDVAFAITADTLLGKHERIPLPCAHLYHPQRPDRKTDEDGRANLALMARYEKAEGDPEAVTALVREHLAAR